MGLVLALLLRRALPSKDDVVIEVYDRAPFLADADAGAGLGLFPNGLRVLRDIGPEVLQGVRGAGAPYHTRRWERPDGVSAVGADFLLCCYGRHVTRSFLTTCYDPLLYFLSTVCRLALWTPRRKRAFPHKTRIWNPWAFAGPSCTWYS